MLEDEGKLERGMKLRVGPGGDDRPEVAVTRAWHASRLRASVGLSLAFLLAI